MQINELILPPNHKKITYQISKNGKTKIIISTHKLFKKDDNQQNIPSIQLGQLNSIQLTDQNKLQNVLERFPNQQVKKQQPKKQQNQREICCSCKMSKCLKMYCECFASKLFCGKKCQCKNCTNTELNSKKLLMIRQQIDYKKHEESRGCKCQKSGCTKKYCECFSRNVKCGEHCVCINCCNIQKRKVKYKNQDP